ncbi:TlpA family protein disulfide reductase [Granulicella sp. WH15]|nr:TlpA family protein disulfide reductase [Granulicella sp. WH15]
MKRSALVVVAMVVGVTLLIWAGVHNRRERSLAMQKAAEKAAMSMPEANAPGAGDGPAQPSLEGKKAAAFSLVDLDGKKVTLADYKGKPVLVNFWATWCAPCKLEMPWFEEFRKKYTDLVILGIAEDDASKEEIAKTAKKAGVTYPILLTDGKVASAYGGVELLPTSFYVGRDGVILTQTAGLGGKDEIEAHIQKLVGAGK